jgi:general secretion pathway protein F
MKTNLYSISTIDARGAMAFQKVEAQSESHAREIVSTAGVTVIQIHAAPSAFASAWGRGLLKVFQKSPEIDTVVFSQDIATLLDAGVTVKDAIGALTKRETSRSKLEVLQQINTSIAEGLSLSAALRKTKAFPQILLATVAASEETGDLATGLSRFAKHQQSLRLVRDKVIGACVYPMLLLGVGSIVVALLLGVVVPRFATLIDSSGKELPLLSKILMGWGHYVDAHPWIPFGLLLGIVAGIAALTAQLKNPTKRKKLLEKIPGVSGVIREFQHLQMYRTTAILTSRGIAIHKALLYSLEFLTPSDQQRLNDALSEIRQGVSVSVALEKTGLSDVVASSMLAVAERTGAMSEMLDRIADFYERTLQRNIDIVSRLIEPVLMIIFGIVIGGIVVLMYLPIFDLASSIS